VSLSADQLARLRLIRSENVGPITYFQLIARFGSAERALSAIPDLAARGGGRAPRIASRAQVEREIEAVARFGADYLFLGTPEYPPLLAELETAPPALIVKGHRHLLSRTAIAMVGARNASAAAAASLASWRRGWGGGRGGGLRPRPRHRQRGS
jgi:DNA processing protein